MKENKKNLGSDLAKVDAHVVQPEEYEELPEWTDEMFDRAAVYIRGKRVRRSQLEKPKQSVDPAPLPKQLVKP